MQAKDWTFAVGNEEGRPPTDDEKCRFATVLLSREKQQKNKLEPLQIGGVKTQDIFRIANDRSGQFELFHTSHNPAEGKYRVYRHLVFGLRFNRRDIEEWFDLKPNGSSNDVDLKKGSRGRRAAQWWPDFAEELAIYVHEVGIPAGQGAEGQSEVIGEIFDRLAQRGSIEPNRTSVQPVISNLLKRLRSAEKSKT